MIANGLGTMFLVNFRYDRKFLLQFMNVCKDKPSEMSRINALQLNHKADEPSHSMGLGGFRLRGFSRGMGPPSSTAARHASISLNIPSSGLPLGGPGDIGAQNKRRLRIDRGTNGSSHLDLKPLQAGSKAHNHPLSANPLYADGRSSISMEKSIDNDVEEFFAIRDLDEAEHYFMKLPQAHRHLLVNKLVSAAIELKKADAKLVANLFERANEKDLCSPQSFEMGLLPVAGLLDEIVIDAPNAFDLMAMMMEGANLGVESQEKIVCMSLNGYKLITFSA